MQQTHFLTPILDCEKPTTDRNWVSELVLGSHRDGTFVTRHQASCTYSMVEEAAIPFLGYLPQDMERSDVFSYYHPQDLRYLKQVYDTIMLEQGKPFR